MYEHAIGYEKDVSIAENGALVAYSGVKTGRSPKDKRIVKHPDSERNVWWGPVNIPCEAQTFAINRQRAIDYYAKAINLTPESEPDIFQALRFGAVLENVVLDEERGVDFADTSITENTRGDVVLADVASAGFAVFQNSPWRVAWVSVACGVIGYAIRAIILPRASNSPSRRWWPASRSGSLQVSHPTSCDCRSRRQLSQEPHR